MRQPAIERAGSEFDAWPLRVARVVAAVDNAVKVRGVR